HEAAVGRIAQEEIEYLMARGLDEEEATSTIVRGFLDVKINGLPPELNKELQEVVEECHKGM
ncbi:MAG: SufD family Fe-S cluster assembly protein, partial [Thermodesulfobacteriota bacterium]